MHRVMVTWVDARSEDGWTELSELDVRVARINTVGYVVDETEDILCVAGSVDEVTKQVSGLMFIPKVCIINKCSLTPLVTKKSFEEQFVG